MNILKAWRRLKPLFVNPIPIGLINQTYRVDTETGVYVLQKLHPVFSPNVNADIRAVTSYLDAHRFVTPKLIPTDLGELYVLEHNDCWRLLSYVSGITHHKVTHRNLAYSAGRLVGQFHKTLLNFDYQYQAIRSNVHNTPAYLDRLEDNLTKNSEHRYFKQVSQVAIKLINDARQIENLWALPARNSHGDLKISNLLFDNADQAICLLDLDTLGKMPWAMEMGDAFRSWCNPRGEDQSGSEFDLAIYQAGLSGYQEQVWDLWTETEKNALIDGIKLIPMELCARFLIDIFEDHYWKWDNERFETRAEHNWVRAMGQWTLYEDILRKL